MKKIGWKRTILGFCFFALLQGHAQNQEDDPNQVYTDFARAYHEMDASKIDQLYTPDALLLNLYDASEPSSIRGNTAIADFFAKMFDRFGKNGQKLELTFKIIDRQRLEDAILDNGFYTLTIIGPDQPNIVSFGKLSTLLRWQEGRWRFAVDANSNTDQVEYQNSEGDEIPRKP